jgi:hypothetical protein
MDRDLVFHLTDPYHQTRPLRQTMQSNNCHKGLCSSSSSSPTNRMVSTSVDMLLNPEHAYTFPMMFTIDGHLDHGVILVNPMLEYDLMVANLARAIRHPDGPNNGLHAGKHFKLTRTSVVWDARAKASGWPAVTEFSQANYHPVLRLMQMRAKMGKDDRIHIVVGPR